MLNGCYGVVYEFDKYLPEALKVIALYGFLKILGVR